MTHQGHDNNVFAQLLASGGGSTANADNTGAPERTQNDIRPLGQDIFNSLLQSNGQTTYSNISSNDLLPASAEPSTRIATNAQFAMATNRGDHANSESDDREEIVRAAKEVSREIDSFRGARPIETMISDRNIETLSMTPTGRMLMRNQVRRWREAKATGRSDMMWMAIHG